VFVVRLDRNLTAQQLWAIASDRQHLSYDLLDEIVDHPATYRALSDWAVDALGASDISGLVDPPAPEVEAVAPKRGFRLPGLGRRDSEPEIGEIFSPDPPPSEQVPAVNPWLTVNPAIDQNPMTLQQPAPQTTPQSVVQQAKPQAAFEPQAQATPQPKLQPQVQGTSGVVAKTPDWLHRPAPMGAVIVLGVIQILVVLALATVAMRPTQTPSPVVIPTVTATSTVTVTPTATPSTTPTVKTSPSVTPSVVATKRSMKP
jgi:hypothetical protein